MTFSVVPTAGRKMEPAAEKYKYVRFAKGKWQARITFNGRKYLLGAHETQKEAVVAVDRYFYSALDDPQPQVRFVLCAE